MHPRKKVPRISFLISAIYPFCWQLFDYDQSDWAGLLRICPFFVQGCGFEANQRWPELAALRISFVFPQKQEAKSEKSEGSFDQPAEVTPE